MEQQSATKRLAQLLEDLPVGVVVLEEASGKLLYYNRRAVEDSGKTAAQLQGHTYEAIFVPGFWPVYEQMRADCRRDGQEHTRMYYKGERRVWKQIAARPIIWLQETPAILLTLAKVADEDATEYAYKRLAYYDSLLGLPNARKLDEDIAALDPKEPVTMIYFELERLADISDLFGWEMADELLLQIRNWLIESEIYQAQVYRVNNGFALLGRHTNLAQAKERAAAIVRRFEEPWYLPSLIEDYPLYCSVSLGIVDDPYVRNSTRNLLLRTIRAPKTPAGYAIYDEQTDAEAKRALLLRQTLINCVQQDMLGFSVCYQPIVEAKTYRWLGAEALCRWVTPLGQEVTPLEFINLAEQLGLIAQVDNWVREKAMRDCMAWGLQDKDFFLDVNFSPTQNITDVFIQELLRALNATGYPAIMLNLEITESSRIHYTEELFTGIGRLKEAGIMLSLDDFGTGYSSLEHLIKMPAAALKIEKIFLDYIEQDTYRQYLLQILVDIAHHLGMKLVAEGVESAGQRDLMDSYGVDYMQGYLFSRPLSHSQFEQVLERYQDKQGF